MEDMAEYDRWIRGHSMNNFYCESNSNMFMPWVDPEEENTARLEECINGFMRETRSTLQIQQIQLHTLSLRLDNLIDASRLRLQPLHLFEEDSAIEEDTGPDLYLTNDFDSPKIIEPQPYIAATKDFIWPTTSLPISKAFVHTQQLCEERESQIGSTSDQREYHAKLEGALNRNPWDVQYDAYYGRKPLFDSCERVFQGSLLTYFLLFFKFFLNLL